MQFLLRVLAFGILDTNGQYGPFLVLNRRIFQQVQFSAVHSLADLLSVKYTYLQKHAGQLSPFYFFHAHFVVMTSCIDKILFSFQQHLAKGSKISWGVCLLDFLYLYVLVSLVCLYFYLSVYIFNNSPLSVKALLYRGFLLAQR